MVIYSGEKGHNYLQEKWILALAKSVETFFVVSISDMPSIRNWQSLGTMMDTTKYNIIK